MYAGSEEWGGGGQLDLQWNAAESFCCQALDPEDTCAVDKRLVRAARDREQSLALSTGRRQQSQALSTGRRQRAKPGSIHRNETESKARLYPQEGDREQSQALSAGRRQRAKPGSIHRKETRQPAEWRRSRSCRSLCNHVAVGLTAGRRVPRDR